MRSLPSSVGFHKILSLNQLYLEGNRNIYHLEYPRHQMKMKKTDTGNLYVGEIKV